MNGQPVPLTRTGLPALVDQKPAQRHALLSPSSAYRWMTCPGSIRMSRGIERKSSFYADEGSAAHDLASRCLREGTDPAQYIGENILGFVVDEDMADDVRVYVDFCAAIDADPAVTSNVEMWLSLDHLGLEGLDGGTGDYIAYHPLQRRLTVVDFKYGRGVVVEPENNPQAMHYALAAMYLYRHKRIDTVQIVIVQPRAPHTKGPVRIWDTEPFTLFEFEGDVTQAAVRALSDNAPLHPGVHCKFCPAAAVCPARHQQVMEIAQGEFDVVTGNVVVPPVEEMTPERLSFLLRQITILEDYARRVREYALAEAERGRPPTGWKLVGSRPTRKWIDEDEAAAIFKTMKINYLTEPTLKSPAQVEKLLDKKSKAELLPTLVRKVSSGSVLAPLEDPRPALRPDAQSEFEVLTHQTHQNQEEE